MKKAFLLMLCLMVVLTTLVPVMPVSAANSMTVDCGSVLRAVTHCASGSLYGITETKPADIASLVTPLKPAVFTNPARAGSGYQQPIGAAIPSAGRITGTTGKVMIRLADIYPYWPYQFTNMTDFLNKVTAVINDKKASGYSNFYGYEIWNEPNATWNSSKGDFNSMLWKQTYDKIRSLDPGAPIVGPSYSEYNRSWFNTFLSYAKANNCLPDVICWHELGGGGGSEVVSAHIRDYRALETSLGISARKISINEYCDPNHALEGQPGSSARYIAKFERYKIDNACISWWFTNAPGRLGSLLATDTQKGAGWWFYKWYGDMTGNMVSVTPPNDNSNLVDGAACVDSSARYISLLFGGPNDGTVNVTFKNVPSFIGSTATVKVEKVDWTSKDTVSQGPLTVSAKNYTVSSGQFTVSVTGCNASSGYRIYVLPGISSSTTRYEAEKAAITEANVFSNSVCSNGSYVGQIDFSNSTMPKYSYVDFLINAPSTKTYTMTIKYANGTGANSTQGLAYNGGAWSTITYPNTGGWFSAGNSGGTVSTSVNLTAGINVIRLAKGSPNFAGGTGYAELDYIEVK